MKSSFEIENYCNQNSANKKKSFKPSIKDLDECVDNAKKYEPQVIEITRFNEDKLNICFFGCHGSKGEHTRKLAEKINERSNKDPAYKPDLFILLGDNWYPDGVSSPNDERFENEFYKVFANSKLNAISQVPFIVALGNHDEGRCKERELKLFANSVIPGFLQFKLNKYKHKKAALQQVAHTFLPHETDPVSWSSRELASKLYLLKQDKIPYHFLPKFIMPHFYHSWIIGKVQIFAMNSNTYAKEFLKLLKDFSRSPVDKFSGYLSIIEFKKNQAKWASENYKKAKDNERQVIWAWHHPIETFGKRYYDSGNDAKYYLNPLEMTQYESILKLDPDDKCFKHNLAIIFKSGDENVKNCNYNNILKTILNKFQKIKPDILLAAHDHSNYYLNNGEVKQYISGTAGNPKDFQHRLRYDESLSLFSEEPGYSMLTCDLNGKEPIAINTFFNNDVHLKFNNNENNNNENPPVAIQNKLDKETALLKTMVVNACDEYRKFLAQKQTDYKGGFFKITNNTTHKINDVKIMHNLLNYFNQVEVAPNHKVIQDVHDQLEKIENKDSPHSLYLCLYTEIEKTEMKKMDKNSLLKKLFSEKYLQIFEKSHSTTSQQVSYK